MEKFFTYTKSSDETFNSLVDCTLDLARECYSGKKEKTNDYMEKNRSLLEAMGKKGVEGTRYEADFEQGGLSIYSRPMVRNNSTVRDNFDAVIAQVVNAIVPEVTNDTFSRYIAEIHQVGYGETARFLIESNDLFKVNEKAEGIRGSVDQPMFDNEITVNAHPITVQASIDWYPFAAGIFDMGNFAVKIGRSFMAYIFIKSVKGMTSATTAFGTAYTINGYTPALWGTLKSRVSAANGGMNVIAIGTAVALSNISAGGNYQIQIGEEMNKVGYLDQYLGTPLIGLENVLVPGTTNSTASLVLPDDKIYMIPVGGSRPIKIVFEGEEISVSTDPENTSDKRYGISVEMRVGISAITGSKYGTIDL